MLNVGDIVIRAYAHEPEEWGIIISLETVIVDPRQKNESEDDLLEYVYATVLWPDSYTTQEVDYELWTPEEAISYAIKQSKICYNLTVRQ